MRKLDTIQKEHLLNHAFATDNPDKSGANHFYTVMDSKDKVIMGYIRFQQGARGGRASRLVRSPARRMTRSSSIWKLPWRR